MNHDPEHFIVSYQLLQLLRWLVEHEPEMLRRLVVKALRNGFNELLMQQEVESDEQVQQHILDFFSLLEAFLCDVVTENDTRRGLQRSLIPAIDRIDTTACDAYLVAQSIDKAAALIEDNPCQDPKEVLCRELLKRWKPAKKIVSH